MDEVDPAPMQDEFLTLAEAAKRYKVSRMAIYIWRLAGLPSQQVGSRILVNTRHADAWVSQHKPSFYAKVRKSSK